VLLAVAGGLAVASQRAQAAPEPIRHAGGHEAHAPAPADLGGSFVLQDLRGAPVTSESLKGRWTLMFFGYSRCTEACALAAPTLAEASRRLRDEGLPAQAVFVDIDAMPSPAVRPRRAELIAAMPHAEHGVHDAPAAASGLARKYGDDLLVVSGTRLQVNRAAALFHVNREHVPARPKEHGHSINHTSFVYVLAPDGRVVAFLEHDLSPAAMAAEVQRLAAG
ncbi:SCO family protein, partial [Caulobacter sp. 17J65-9]|uniref:SCO family protein n=1 Tax=Caulobacter sp. 17J65-9 TaxID=2709382 RepID=UPI0013CC29D6